jgi:hypothetical protein
LELPNGHPIDAVHNDHVKVANDMLTEV